MLRSTFVSLFWAVINHRRKEDKFRFQQLADGIQQDKSTVSKWFNSEPNWQLNTIADIANFLGLELRIEARDRISGQVFTASGLRGPVQTTSLQEDSRGKISAPLPVTKGAFENAQI
jgi:transcriptional regulator with XRE-family HTH domain